MEYLQSIDRGLFRGTTYKAVKGDGNCLFYSFCAIVSKVTLEEGIKRLMESCVKNRQLIMPVVESLTGVQCLDELPHFLWKQEQHHRMRLMIVLNVCCEWNGVHDLYLTPRPPIYVAQIDGFVEPGHPHYPHPEHGPFFSTHLEYAQYMGKDCVYGNNSEIFSAALLFDMKINVAWFLPNNNYQLLPVNSECKRESAALLFFGASERSGGGHYCPVLNLVQCSQSPKPKSGSAIPKSVTLPEPAPLLPPKPIQDPISKPPLIPKPILKPKSKPLVPPKPTQKPKSKPVSPPKTTHKPKPKPVSPPEPTQKPKSKPCSAPNHALQDSARKVIKESNGAFAGRCFVHHKDVPTSQSFFTALGELSGGTSCMSLREDLAEFTSTNWFLYLQVTSTIAKKDASSEEYAMRVTDPLSHPTNYDIHLAAHMLGKSIILVNKSIQTSFGDSSLPSIYIREKQMEDGTYYDAFIPDADQQNSTEPKEPQVVVQDCVRHVPDVKAQLLLGQPVPLSVICGRYPKVRIVDVLERKQNVKQTLLNGQSICASVFSGPTLKICLVDSFYFNPLAKDMLLQGAAISGTSFTSKRGEIELLRTPPNVSATDAFSRQNSEEMEDAVLNLPYDPPFEPDGGLDVAARLSPVIEPQSNVTAPGTYTMFTRQFRRTWMWAATFRGERPQATSLDFGEMKTECPRCGALFRDAEMLQKKKDGALQFRSVCCGKDGRIHELLKDKTFREPSVEMQELFSGNTEESKNFLKIPTLYNAAFSMAHQVVNRRFENIRGINFNVVVFNGKLAYFTGKRFHPNQHLTMGALFLNEDVEWAAAQRKALSAIPQILDLNVIIKIENYLRKHNVMYRTLQTAGQILNSEKSVPKDLHVVFNPRPRHVWENTDTAFADKIRASGGYPLATPKGAPVAIVSEVPPHVAYDYKMSPRSAEEEIYISKTKALIDVLTFPLIHLHGEPSHVDVDAENVNKTMHKTTENLTLCGYYGYQIMRRRRNTVLHKSKRLFVEYLISAAIKIDDWNLRFIKLNQSLLFRETRKNVFAQLGQLANESNLRMGKKVVICPESYYLGPRFYRKCFLRCMTMERDIEESTYFFTVTFNPMWPWVVRDLESNGLPARELYNNPDIISRGWQVFVDQVFDDFLDKQLLGRITGYVAATEDQTNGNPHLHGVLFLNPCDVPRTSDQIDAIITSEIPTDHELRDLVIKWQIHRPCEFEEGLPCRKDGPCNKRYPFSLQEQTVISRRGAFTRRRPGPFVDIPKWQVQVDNSYVVPHNRRLLKRYLCSQDWKVFRDEGAFAYVFGYLTNAATGKKGQPNFRSFTIDKGLETGVVDWDEVGYVQSFRSVAGPAAVRTILGRNGFLSNVYFSHSLEQLPVHLPGEDFVTLPGETEEDIQRALSQPTRSKLLKFFEAVEEHGLDNTLYQDIPKTFSWEGNRWQLRPRGTSCLGVVMPVSVSSDREKYALYQLLLNIPGPRNFEALRTHNGVEYATFEEATVAIGLTYGGDAINETILELKNSQLSPFQIRCAFALMVQHNTFDPSDLVRECWETIKDAVIGDFINNGDNLEPDDCYDLALKHVWSILKAGKIDATKCPLRYVTPENQSCPIRLEDPDGVLNADQEAAFQSILSAVYDSENEAFEGTTCFFVSGCGGTGKTFLYRKLGYYLQTKGKSCVFSAYTATAAQELPGALTCHAAFGIPISLPEGDLFPTSWLNRQHAHAVALANASVVFVDEISMMKSWQLSVIDLLCQHVTGSCKIFGGKVVVVGGDFRQTLPICSKEEGDVLSNCVFSNSLWCSFKVLQLNLNMRAVNDPDYAEWCLTIGDGSANEEEEPSCTMFPLKIGNQPVQYANDLDSLVTTIFEDEFQDHRRTIICNTNKECCEINNIVIARLFGPHHTYFSMSLLEKMDNNDGAEVEDFLLIQTRDKAQSLLPSGMPYHTLHLKVGCIVFLPFTLNHYLGLVNGTRMLVTKCGTHIICCQVLTGRMAGQEVCLPRLTCRDDKEMKGMVLIRHQFPIRLAYGITVHRSQARTFEYCGYYLKTSVFAHGMLYTGIARVGETRRIVFFIPDGAFQGRRVRGGAGGTQRPIRVTNIVDSTVLNMAHAPRHIDLD